MKSKPIGLPSVKMLKMVFKFHKGDYDGILLEKVENGRIWVEHNWLLSGYFIEASIIYRYMQGTNWVEHLSRIPPPKPPKQGRFPTDISLFKFKPLDCSDLRFRKVLAELCPFQVLLNVLKNK